MRLEKPLAPGSTIGILGGGQLGRMLALAAGELGFKCHIFAPEDRQPGVSGFCRTHGCGLSRLRGAGRFCEER